MIKIVIRFGFFRNTTQYWLAFCRIFGQLKFHLIFFLTRVIIFWDRQLTLNYYNVGWIVTKNQIVYDNMAAYKDYTSICNSGPSELLSIIALKQYPALVARNKQIIKDNIAILNQFFFK